MAWAQAPTCGRAAYSRLAPCPLVGTYYDRYSCHLDSRFGHKDLPGTDPDPHVVRFLQDSEGQVLQDIRPRCMR